ncbi:hypothetical protein INR99_12510 [Chitinilyticum litopenaei]|uniref:Uncharacterized protein n=2 Tax=Chitinilyticum piscinae TaxID=2866724 RepID=A0A8J7KG38_9NEIS|nr:hypothetical protein [Chitinilyticum piscinae]
MLALPLVLALQGCDQINQALNKQQANGKAIGAACRHSGRALEDCYRRNPKIAKADIYAGWREMNEYMVSKKIDIVPPPPDAQMSKQDVDAPAASSFSEHGAEPKTEAKDAAAHDAKAAPKTEAH